MNKLISADRHFNMDSSGTESLVEPLVAVRGTAGGASVSASLLFKHTFLISADVLSSHLVEVEEVGEDGEPGKANCLCWSWCSSESTRSGMPGEVPTVSLTTSSGSRM